jgi:phosphoribosylformylglycinamidine synthase subunit PurQ / glutaminase
MRVAVITFPGSNCDADARNASRLVGADVHAVFHKDTALPSGVDLVILPGGFSYGDYLRTGAIARFSPIMKEVVDFAKKGGLVMGVCNGFQILCETGLLPGALARNINLSFVCKDVLLRVENADTPFTSRSSKGTVLRIPVAHGEGRFVASEDVLEELEAEQRVVFRYVDADGAASPDANPNGSLNNIAGIINAGGNVMGMMPHPERAAEAILGSADGMTVFASLAAHLSSVPVTD